MLRFEKEGCGDWERNWSFFLGTDGLLTNIKGNNSEEYVNEMNCVPPTHRPDTYVKVLTLNTSN